MYVQLDFKPHHERMIEHHESRRDYWLSQGKPEYAEGSARKADKWRVAAREYDAFFNGSFPKTQIDILVMEHFDSVEAKLAKDIEDALYGGRIKAKEQHHPASVVSK